MDTCSANVVYTDEGLEEVRKHLMSRDAYVDPIKGLTSSINVDTLKLVLKNLTYEPAQ